MRRMTRTATAIVICVSAALSTWVGVAGAAPGDLQSVDLTPLARHDLASPGLDGEIKPRGQNGELAVLGDMVFVAGGPRFHGAQSSPGRICTDYGGVKVVDVSDPSAPVLRSTIQIADAKTVLSGPAGNPRRGASVPNVSAAVSTVAAIDHPIAGKKVLAIATQRCEQSFFNGARIEFWDVSNPSSPTMMGVFDPANIPNPQCNPTCPPGVPANGQWGIFEDVRMFTRNNGPGGATKVYAVATSPFSIGNSHDASPQGDFRLLDVSDPANVQQIDTFPKSSISSTVDNGCRTFDGGRSAAPSPDGRRAILSWYDGAKPSDTAMAGPNSAALFNLDLDNLPQYQAGTSPKQFLPSPPTWGFPLGEPGGATPAGEVEGNAADVQPFSGPGGSLMTFMSEEDLDPALTNFTINAPASAAYSGRACETLFARKLHQRAGQQLAGQVAYVGRGCPASPLAKSTLRSADPYLESPAGKIALFESGGDGFDGCSAGAKIRRAAAAGATGVLFNIGGNFLSLVIPGPDGGIPAVPTVAVQQAAFDKMAGLVPNRVLSGTGFPAAYDRTVTTTTVTTSAATGSGSASIAVNPLAGALPAGTVLQFPATPPATAPVQVVTSANAAGGATSLSIEPLSTGLPSGVTGAVTNVSVARLALAVMGATNTSPIEITTATHGLRTGDRVSITDVGGNTAANGSFTVTVTSSTKFTLDGSAGNGAFTNGGIVRLCRPSDPNCSPADAARTDMSRWRSEANAGDRSARGRVATRFAVTAGQSYRASALVEVAAHVDGDFTVAVTWHDAGGAEISRSQVASVGAVSPRSLSAATVTAPAGAVTGSIVFEWTGATAEGVAFVDGLALVPSALNVTLKDNQGVWGAQRIIDFSKSPPVAIGEYRSPRSKLWPPPNDGVYAPRLARLAGSDLALTTWMSDGLRVLDIKDPSAPREIGAYVPPDVDDPSPQAGAGPTNLRDSENPNLLRGQSWPDRALVNGVGYIPKSSTSGIVVISDINAGLYVLKADIKREAAAQQPAPPPPPPSARPTALLPSKLALLRARILSSERALDVFARITRLASGSAPLELHAAGRRTKFNVLIRDGRIKARRRIPEAQAQLGTGILTITYRGDRDTRPQTVRLRAAAQPADLTVRRPTISGGRLRASGRISSRARGVVRVQIQYVADGKTVTLSFKATIRSGRWSLNERLSQSVRNAIAQRTGSVHSYTLFTGYLQARMRGEMRSYQVLGSR